MRPGQRDRAFENGACIEPAATPSENDPERYEGLDVVRCGSEHALERRDRIVETTVLAQERCVVETRVKRGRRRGDRPFEIAESVLARRIGGPPTRRSRSKPR
jgi:hypothetical protein